MKNFVYTFKRKEDSPISTFSTVEETKEDADKMFAGFIQDPILISSTDGEEVVEEKINEEILTPSEPVKEVVEPVQEVESTPTPTLTPENKVFGISEDETETELNPETLEPIENTEQAL